MRKVNYVKLIGVIAMLSPMSFAQTMQLDEAHLKSHTMMPADNTYVDISAIRYQAQLEYEKAQREQEENKQEIIISSEAPKAPEILSDIEPFPGAVEVTGLQGESFFDIQEDLNNTLKTAQENTLETDKEKNQEPLIINLEAPKAPELLLADIEPFPGAVEVKDLKGESFFDIQEDLNRILKEAKETPVVAEVVEVGQLQEIEPATEAPQAQVLIESEEDKEKANLEKIVCDQKNQIADLTKTIEELKQSTQAPMDSMYQMMSQLMMMNQMMMMQNQQSGGFYQRAGSNYEIMNSYLEPMRMMSSMMFSNQQMMLSNMYGSNFGAMNSSGPVYNVTGDYYAGAYTNTATTTSPQNYQLPLPAAMSADYRNFGDIIQAPRSSAGAEEKTNIQQVLDVPQTTLNDISEAV